MKRPGLFVDRDGTINEEVDFLTNPDHLHILPGAVEALRSAMQMGFRIVVTTNQSGVARGLLTEQRLLDIHASLKRRLESEGVILDAIYYCPHHPDYGEPPYRVDCDCRKPKPGMIRQAERELDIDLSRSFVVGDRMIDIQAGNALGLPSILVLSGYGQAEVELCRNNNVPITHVAADLREAVEHIRQTVHASNAFPRS